MRRALRWLATGLVALLALVVLLIAGLLVTLHTDWGRELVRRQLQARLTEIVDGRVIVGPIRGSVLSRLYVEGLIVQDRDGLPAITARRLLVDYELFSLLRHSFVANEIEILAPVVLGHRGVRGETNLAHLMKPSPPTDNPWGVRVEALRVRDGLVVMPTPAETYSFAGVNIDA